MNAAFRGAENLAPRGHPNDGRLDLIDGQLASHLDRRRAHKRTYAGSHVPHPNLEETRVRDISISNETELYVELTRPPESVPDISRSAASPTQ